MNLTTILKYTDSGLTSIQALFLLFIVIVFANAVYKALVYNQNGNGKTAYAKVALESLYDGGHWRVASKDVLQWSAWSVLCFFFLPLTLIATFATVAVVLLFKLIAHYVVTRSSYIPAL